MVAGDATPEMLCAVEAFNGGGAQLADFLVQPQTKSQYTLIRPRTWPRLLHYEFRSNRQSELFVELHAEGAGYAALGMTFKACAERVGLIQGFPVEYHASRPYPNYKKWPSLSIALPVNVDGSLAASVMRDLIKETRPEVERAWARGNVHFVGPRSAPRKGPEDL
jgi:hypothetical protein